MPITRVNDVYRQDTTDAAPTHTITGTTAGNGLIIAFVWNNATGTLSSVAMSGETVTPFTNAAGAYADLGRSAALYYVKNLSSGGNKTVTATLSGADYWTCAIMEITGQDTAVFDDGSGNYDEGLSANPSIPITTSVANAFLYGVVVTQSNNATAGSGFTPTTATWSAFAYRNFAEYKADAGGAGSTNALFTLASDRWLGIAVAVRPVGGAPSLGATITTNSGANYSTSNTTTDLAGTSSLATSVTWANDTGGSGSASYADDAWTITGIALSLGANVITVTAHDNGNTATDTITVTRDVVWTRTAVQTDNFADNDLTAGSVVWTQLLPVIGGTLRNTGGYLDNPNGSNLLGSIRADGTYSDDQYAKMKVLVLPSGVGFIGIVVRSSTATDAARTYYDVFINFLGSLIIRKVVSGAETDEVTISSTFVANDILEVEVSGGATTTIKVFKNGSQVSSYVDSSSPITTGKPGITIQGTVARADDWEGGNLSVGAAVYEQSVYRFRRDDGVL